MELGSRRSSKHIEVVGEPNKFYVLVREVPFNETDYTCSSDWFRGEDALEKFDKLRQLYKNGNKAEWASYARELPKSNPHREL